MSIIETITQTNQESACSRSPRPFTAALLAVFYVFAFGCGLGSAPKARDAAGKPVFDDTQVRHVANTPYFCFRRLDRDNQECSGRLTMAKNEGLTILGGCQSVEKTFCFVAYTSGGMINTSSTFCWETQDQCAAMSARVGRDGAENVSACKMLNRMFQPTG
jgi:hypothetical protein